MMWNQWKMFDKMTWIVIYLGAQNDPEIGPLAGTNIQHTSNGSIYTKTDAQAVGIFWENDQRPEFWLIWRAHGGPKIGPLRPIFSTHLKVLGMSMWSNTVVKPVKTFWESDQTPEIYLTLGPKIAQKLGLWGPYFTHLWK